MKINSQITASFYPSSTSGQASSPRGPKNPLIDSSSDSYKARKSKNKTYASPQNIIETPKFSNELIEAGFAQVTRSMAPANARGAAVQRATDFYKNMDKIGLLAANAGPKKGTAAVSLELTSIRRDTLTMMNRLPAEVNIQIADAIKLQIEKNEWPTDKETINTRIKEISDQIVSKSRAV